MHDLYGIVQNTNGHFFWQNWPPSIYGFWDLKMWSGPPKYYLGYIRSFGIGMQLWNRSITYLMNRNDSNETQTCK